jgi:hypothetical protein
MLSVSKRSSAGGYDFSAAIGVQGAPRIGGPATDAGKSLMELIRKRVVLHFPGFEPLDGTAQHARYERSARQSGKVWGFEAEISGGETADYPVRFDVSARSAAWETRSSIFILDHDELVQSLRGKNLLSRMASGFAAAGRIVIDGAMVGYFKHAWRFGLFFIFPFLLMTLGTAIAAAIALLPVEFGLSVLHLLWSLPLGAAFFHYIFLPFTERFHTLHLFSDWEMAVALGRMDRKQFNDWLEKCAAAARVAFDEEADEYIISSHSMGSSVAAHVIGSLLEREPELFAGKRVVFASLGSAILQCALLRPATRLRARVGLIAGNASVFWLDVQCLTDAIHFYKVPVVAVTGHATAPAAHMLFIRVKQMLTPEHYKKIKLDFLRVHRQYVLGPDLRAPFDFTLLTAGPVPGRAMAEGALKAMP